jgi:hypothetical protein
MREQVFNRSQLHQDRMKEIFNKHSKQEDFKVNDLVLKWDARNEEKGKHGNLIIFGWVHLGLSCITGKTNIFYKSLMENSLVGGL